MSDLKQQLASGALEKLSLRGCELSSREIPDLLLKLQACTKLKSLNLSRNRISDQTGWLTVLLEKLPGIETLMLKRCNLQTLEIPACELRVLSVSDNRMAWLTVSERTPLLTLLADSTGSMMNRLVKDLPLSLRQLSARQCELTEASAKTILR
jgi:Leucine-rich repeat (LRR) protein